MKRLILSPHVDDDVLGCSSVLDAETVTFYAGVDSFHVVSANGRHEEAYAVAERTGGIFHWPLVVASRMEWPSEEQRRDGCRYYSTEREVNHYDERSLTDDFENLLAEYEPEEVFVPWPSFNADHRAVYHAALVALRPHDKNWFVPRVFLYEGSQILFWDWANPGTQFHPNYFVPFDFEKKTLLYASMPSQMRSFRSHFHLEALARLRGGEIGVPHAEAFQILRWVGEK